MTIYIGSDNVDQFSKVQGARSYIERDEVVLLWDELNRRQRRVAKSIDIDIKVQTNDPSSVPDKWTDDIEQVGETIDTTDIVKMVIANPARRDVFELLKDEDPPEPLVLWWLNNTFDDPDYFQTLSDACLYALFRGDNTYLWAAIAFGVEGGVGRFRWPESDKDSRELKQVKKKVREKFDIREKELELAWGELGEQLARKVELTENQAEALGIEVTENEEEDEDESGPQTSLLDL